MDLRPAPGSHITAAAPANRAGCGHHRPLPDTPDSGDGVTWPLGSPSGLLASHTVAIAISLSLAFHAAITLALGSQIPWELPEFWWFLGADATLWAICLVPLVAAAQRALAWFDPIFWLSSMTFASSATIYLAYLWDPSFALASASRGSYRLSYLTEGQILALWAEAELITLLFLLVILFINQRPVNFDTARQPARIELKAALVVSVTMIAAGIFGFARLWSSASLVDSLSLHIGAVQLEPDSVRYLTLQTLAGYSVPLAIIALLGLNPRLDRAGIRVQGLLLLGILVSVVPRLMQGSRITVVFTTIMAVVVLRHFGISIRLRYGTLLGIVALTAILWITLLRGNPFVSGSVEQLLDELIGGRVVESYLATTELRQRSPLLDMDRVQIIGVIIENTRNRDTFLDGASLWGGIANFGQFLLGKLPGRWAGEPVYHWESHDYINYWRFGTRFLDSGSNPPSYAGEFFMQGGYVSLVALSAFLGLIFRWLRHAIARSRLLTVRWLLLSIALILATYYGSLMSYVYRFLYSPLLPIAAACLAVTAFMAVAEGARFGMSHQQSHHPAFWKGGGYEG